MSATDAEYYQSRAEQELERAQKATDPKVVAAHYALAELYLERVAVEGKTGLSDAARPQPGKDAPDSDRP